MGDITSETFEGISDNLLTALSSATTSSAFLGTRDLIFFKSSCPELTSVLDSTGEKILNMCNQIMTRGTKRLKAFEELDDVVDRYDEVIDIVDSLLEKADICLDEAKGKNKKNGQGNTPLQAAPVVMKLKSSGVNARQTDYYQVVHAQNITRPQLLFEDKIDNTNTPFIRRLKEKHNAMKPLDDGMPSSGQLTPEMVQHIKTLGITDVNSSQYTLPHPYEYEIQNIPYPSDMFEIRPEVLYKPLDEKPLRWVDTKEALEIMMEEIKDAKELAVDIEFGFQLNLNSIMISDPSKDSAISTREEDYLIDTLALRSHLHVLNIYTSDPKIVKIFHGAEMDIVWLQRDFGIYVVNLFDTYHASHALELPSHGLAYLLKFYCNVDTNKKFQTADWRIRPLPKEMLKYARMDTHYLPYIYDRMRNEVLSRSDAATHQLLHVVLRRSEQTALKLYEKEFYDSDGGEGPNGWRSHLKKFPYSLNQEQMAVYKAVHAWRDHVARDEDESVRYVIPTHMLMNLATDMPKDVAGVLSCCNPVPNLVRLYASDLALLIEKAVQDAKQNISNRMKDIARQHPEIEAREREREIRKAEGPLHIRFGDEEEVGLRDFTASTGPLPPNFFTDTLVPVSSRPSKKLQRSAVLTKKEFVSSYGSLERQCDEGYSSAVDSVDIAQAEEVRKSLILKAPGFDLIKKRKRDDVAPSAAPVKTAAAVEKPVMKSAIAEINPKNKKTKHVEPSPAAETIKLTSVQDIDMVETSESKFQYPDGKDLLQEFAPKKKKGGKNFTPYGEVDESGLPTAGRKGPSTSSRNNRTKTMTYKK
ncbi:exosome nuclease subunit [Dinochytrium kinnereticum]|nr:exosome nuclease subunit [Dinochytrium kinnereticum]